MGRSKVLFAALFLFLTVSVVDAYTVVMRDGRRVEIPNQFTVTNSTLAYDMGNAMQITIQLNAVDIAATERANGEAQGALLAKANAPAPGVNVTPQTGRAGAQRSITNQDLEKYRSARLESERQYESQREALGMPSLEERRREVAEIEERTLEQVRSMRAQEEAYWRSRAEALRAANEAQFGTVRQGPDIPWSYSSFPGVFPFDGVGFGSTLGGFDRFRPLPAAPFSGFLATPITPFPTFPVDPVFSRHGRPLVFTTPGVRSNTRPAHVRHGSHR